jgi:hypothetical protein
MMTTVRAAVRHGLTLIDWLQDPRLFGALGTFRDLTTWTHWIVFIKAIYGLPLEPGELEVFRHHTGRTTYAPPPAGFKTVAAIVGRQSGKTAIAATLAAFEAIQAADEPGQRGPLYVPAIAQDHRATLRVLFSYATAPFELPLLKGHVVNQTTDTLTLKNGVMLAAYPCRPPALRGIRARVAICDEIAHYRSTEGNPVDVEMLRAVRPTLATTGGRLILLSSPYGQSGSLWDLYRLHFAKDDSPVLIWKGTAPEMNPLLPVDYLERMKEDDPEGYRSEVLGEFRAGVTALFDPAAIDACVVPGRRELRPQAGVVYRAFVDVSGGRHDAFALCIGHRERELIVVDVLRAWASPFNPSGVVSEAGALLRQYGVMRVRGDDFGAEWTVEAFRANGITYERSIPNRSDLFLGLLAPVNSRAVELLDDPALRRELCGLERRRGLAGRDRVVPAPHEHDDRAVSVAGCVDLLAARRGTPAFANLARYLRDHPEAAAPPKPERPAWSLKDLGIVPIVPRGSGITCSTCGTPDDGSIPGPWLMRPGPDWNPVHTCPRCEAGRSAPDPEGSP